MGLPVYDVSFAYQALTGGVPGAGRVAALGVNEDIDTATQPEDVWAGSVLGTLNGIDHKFIPIPTAAVSMELVSSDANDTAAGTGARLALITYLDSTYTEKFISLAINGTTPVALPEAALAINAFLLADSIGTAGGSNIGGLSIRAAGGLGETYAYIAPGIGIMQTSLYTVPLGYTLDLLAFLCCVNRVDTQDRWATFSLCVRGPNGRLLKGFAVSASSATPYRHEVAGGLPINNIGARNRIWLRCEAVSQNNTSVTGALFGISRSKNLRG